MSTTNANKNPIFPTVASNTIAVLSTAVTDRTVTGVTGLTLLCTAATDGTRVDEIRAMQNGAISTASSANVLRIWLYKGSGNASLYDEIAISAGTPTASAAGTVVSETYERLILKSDEALYCSIHTYAGVQDGYNVFAIGGDY